MAASSSSSPVDEAKPPWEKLPPEITAAILQKLGAVEILLTAVKVCPTWRRVLQDPSLWRYIDMENPYGTGKLYDLEKMCRHAVDLSQGQLVDINIKYFGTANLLLYISQRSSQLSRLRLDSCTLIKGDDLMEALKNFPLLEELHLQNTPINVEAIETVGRYCPLLKSFKCNIDHLFKPDKACDIEALAIAENMPGLRHLELYGNTMTNVGLRAILDGCPNLESLDLRVCINVDLCGDLERLCSQRIKDLKLPHDYTWTRPWETFDLADILPILADVSDDEDYLYDYSDEEYYPCDYSDEEDYPYHY